MAKVTLSAGITSLRGKMGAVYYRTNRNGYNSIFSVKDNWHIIMLE